MRTNTYKTKLFNALNKRHVSSIADLQHLVPNADYSTIYRNVEQMVTEGVVRKVLVDKSTTLYEVVQHTDNHEHFVCTHCGVVEPIHAIEMSGSFTRSHAVTDVLVRGLCNACKTQTA